VREALLILLLALSLNLIGNGQVSLWDRDEPRYAGCTREMRESGDYIYPTFNGEPRFHKPILIYWLMTVGTAIGGDNPFGARLVSAVMGAGSCLLVWWLGRRMFGRTQGRLAALMLATAPIFAYNSKLATTDATLTFFLILCQFALWELSQRASLRWALTFWVAFALATLTKGPIGPVLLAFACGMSWFWGGPTAWFGRLRWGWGVPIYALLTAPWYIAIGILSNGDFFRVSMGYHVFRRMTTGIETHGGFPGYYPVLSMGVFYPWSALLPVAIVGAWSRRKANPAFGFLLGWVVGPMIFLEIVRTKLIHYYLPAYPAAALLAAWLVMGLVGAEVNLRRWPLGRVAMALLTGIGISVTVALLAGAMVAPSPIRWLCLAMALVLAPGTLFAMERFSSGRCEQAAYGLVGTWAVMLALLCGGLLPAIEPYRLTQAVARELATLSASEHATPIMAGYKPPGIVWEMKRQVPELAGRDELAAMVVKEKAVVSALSALEIELLRKDSRIEVEPKGVVRGVDVEHARPTTLELVVIRPAPADGSGASAVARRAREQLLVK
jgi:4-amino-4-deoxy-L-arabinose transferase-like glycosyltransferase